MKKHNRSTTIRQAIATALFALAAIPCVALGYDIADLLGAPIPDPPVAAAQADVIAWSASERGVRNVWMARAPDFAPRKLSDHREDDGQPLTALRLSDDGRWLAYVRGGSPDAGGKSVDPANDPDGVEQAVWLVPTDAAAAPRRVAAGSAAVFSPRGDALAVQAAGALQCHGVEAARKPDWCAETLLKLRGANSAAAFSPDGRALAFVSNRGDHAFVGVLDLAARRVRWMAPDFSRDTSPAWSPDGKRIAFVRQHGLRHGELFDLTGAHAFEVWDADAATGVGRRLFRSGDNAGGYAQSAVGAPLRWSRDGRIVFASEENGWLHWYALPAEGGAPLPLSRGQCEAETAALARDGEFLFSGNCEGIDHRQLFAADARAQRRLTAPDAISTDPVALPGGDWIAFRHADTRLPTAIAVLRRDGGEPRRVFPASLPSTFPLEALVVPQQVLLRAADGTQLHAQLFELATPARGKRPALVYVHGGPIRQMLAGWHYGNYYYHDYAANQWLASRGYLVLSLNFRSGTGYGQAFRRAPQQGPRGMSEYQDVLAAHAYLAGRGDVDPKRIGIYGGSYGGYLTAQALARDSGRFAAGVDRHGVHDWRESAKGGDNSGLWGLKPDETELAWQSSPVAKLDSWRSPVLLVHGDDDRAVKFAQSVDLAARLRERGVAVETLVLPGEEHLFLRHDTWKVVHGRMLDFFDRHLAP